MDIDILCLHGGKEKMCGVERRTKSIREGEMDRREWTTEIVASLTD